MLRIFSDEAYIPSGKPHFVIFYPFWGKWPEDPDDPSAGRYDRYTERGAEFFKITSLESAEIAILPAAWEHYGKQTKRSAIQFVEACRQAGKKCVVFFWNDSDERVALKDVTVFRTSLYASHKSLNEFAMPAWSEDLLQNYFDGNLPFREKDSVPIIGFCGAAPAPPRKTLRQKLSAWNYSEEKEGRFIRKPAIDLLQAGRNVRTNFILRESFLGGAWLAGGVVDLQRLQTTRREFVKNMAESDYILCARGAGNFSYRLYETLSCGRIPIFINTDCVLPYQMQIDWQKYCVWVEHKELSQICDRVAEFHSHLTNEDFKDLQLRCRKLWEEYLSPEGFFANFYRHFQ